MKLELMQKLNRREIIKWGICLLFLAFIAYIGFHVRSINIPPMVADYDPHWYYRHSLDVLNNGFNLPKWDILSFYPPGRPFEIHEGLEYALVFLYRLLGKFAYPGFMQFFIMSSAIIAGLSAVPAYLATKYMSKSRMGALFTALFAVLAPSFISYSVAGYMDSKVFVVFYSFLSIYALMLFMKNKKIWSFLLAAAANLLFIYTWSSGGWYLLMAFLFLLPAVFIFRIFEQAVHKKGLKLDLKMILEEQKSLLVPFLIVMVVVNVITQILLSENILQSILAAAGFVGIGQSLLVNISVAELQPISILTAEGFSRVASLVGPLPTLFTLFGLPVLIFFKMWKKEKISMEEIFLILFALAAFYMILHGTRFALIFSVAAALSAGYVIGNAYRYIRPFNKLLASVFLAVVIMMSISSLSDSFLIGDQASKGYGISQNWVDGLNWLKSNGNSSTLVVTWWDPGHIITDLTGLKVMADGAHCGSDCIPYNHNARIQDMAAAFSTSKENDSIEILKDYVSLTPEQCNAARQKFGDAMPKNACDPINKMYVIASNDLIGKYYWLSYFGSCINKDGVSNMAFCHKLSLDEFKKIAEGRNYMQCDFNQQLSQQLGAYSYACQSYVPTAISLVQKNNSVAAVMNSPQQGVRNVPVKDVILYQNGMPLVFDYSNSTSAIDGLAFVDPSLHGVIYMDAQIRNSIFTNMFFFNGDGNTDLGIPKLNDFKLVYQNPEVRIFEVTF